MGRWGLNFASFPNWMAMPDGVYVRIEKTKFCLQIQIVKLAFRFVFHASKRQIFSRMLRGQFLTATADDANKPPQHFANCTLVARNISCLPMHSV